MAEMRYEALSVQDRRDALDVAKARSGRRARLLEKDVWVVATLRILFNAPFADHLTFKGGTSLLKAWGVIDRFSEDIDITYDIKALVPDLVDGAGDEALPSSRSQGELWTKEIRGRLEGWVRDEARPIVEEELERAGFRAEEIRAEAERLYIRYEPLFEEAATQLVRPEVILEFGARSTGEPHESCPVVCDAAKHLPDLVFPQACPTVMLAERTFWEKATAIHVFCCQDGRKGNHMSRHWHDLVRLDQGGIAVRAISDRELALSVARHKEKFFRKKDADRQWIDYTAAVLGSLKLVPCDSAREVLARDYEMMLTDGMLLPESETFIELMERCTAIEARANKLRA